MAKTLTNTYKKLKAALAQSITDNFHRKAAADVIFNQLLVTDELLDYLTIMGTELTRLSDLHKQLDGIYHKDSMRLDFSATAFQTKVRKFIKERTGIITQTQKKIKIYYQQNHERDQKEINAINEEFKEYERVAEETLRALTQQIKKRNWLGAATLLVNLPEYPVEKIGYYENSHNKKFIPVDHKYIKLAHRLMEITTVAERCQQKIPAAAYYEALQALNEAEIATQQEILQKCGQSLCGPPGPPDDAWLANIETLIDKIKQAGLRANSLHYAGQRQKENLATPCAGERTSFRE